MNLVMLSPIVSKHSFAIIFHTFDFRAYSLSMKEVGKKYEKPIFPFHNVLFR